jgi:hypothetical protein
VRVVDKVWCTVEPNLDRMLGGIFLFTFQGGWTWGILIGGYIYMLISKYVFLGLEKEGDRILSAARLLQFTICL